MTQSPRALIIGAGPGGLTAAAELVERTDYETVVFEQTDLVGGISRTVTHEGNRLDIGGHRFFSKSDRVMDWWLERMPIEEQSEGDQGAEISYQGKKRQVEVGAGPDPRTTDRVMLVRPRKSRIFYRRTFFDYPISLSLDTLLKLGPWLAFRMGISYLWRLVVPIRDPKNLEEFFISRFGGELYRTFFRSYTEKVWGVSCQEISAEWGAQRIKGLSILGALRHQLRKLTTRGGGIRQKGVETSLIEQFLYPKLGPGQMWEIVTAEVEEGGGEVRLGHDVVGLRTDGNRVCAVDVVRPDGSTEIVEGDVVISTMPVQKLIEALDVEVPEQIREISEGLVYRDFITVGLLVRGLRAPKGEDSITDNWIYIQEPDVHLGRLQVFNNWSPWMVADPENTVWLGLEYFCDRGDSLWSKSDDELRELGAAELARLGLIDEGDVLESCVVRVPKTYPAYFGTYDRFDELRSWLDQFENLHLVGRNGMHRYNNQDHSMLTAMVTVDNLVEGRVDRSNVWEVNTEEEYHEERAEAPEG